MKLDVAFGVGMIVIDVVIVGEAAACRQSFCSYHLLGYQLDEVIQAELLLH